MSYAANIALVPIHGDLDVTTVDDARRSIDALIDGGCLRVVLNLADVGYVDSAGMGLIISELRRIRSKGGLLSLACVSRDVFRTLQVLRMVDLMPVSLAGERPQVPELDPSAEPLWRRCFAVAPDGLSVARAHVARLLEGLPLSADAAFDVQLACGEALGNAVDHTSGTGVMATVSAYPDRVVVDVADNGPGFVAPPEVECACAGAERGRGIQLMRLLVDSVTIGQKASGQGTVVRLVKLMG